MRVLIVGCGLVGKELARQLRADGHHVIGTTTTPGKVAALQEVCDEVAVLTTFGDESPEELRPNAIALRFPTQSSSVAMRILRRSTGSGSP